MADPLSVLGAAVGLSSLIIQISDECVKGYHLYCEAIKMPEEYRYLQVRLQIERYRFLYFSLEAGTLDIDRSLCTALQMNRSLFLSVLAEIKTIFDQFTVSTSKYDATTGQDEIECSACTDPEINLNALLHIPLKDTTQKISSQTPHETGYQKSHWRKLGKGMMRTSRRLRTIALEPRRLKWALIDKESFENLIKRLADFNSFLTTLLDSAQISRLELAMDTSYKEILQIRDEIKDLTKLLKALNTDNEINSKDRRSDTASPISNVLDQIIAEENKAQRMKRHHFGKLTEVKIRYKHLLNQDVAEITGSVSATVPLDLALFNMSPMCESLNEDRTTATYKDGHVLIEWQDRQLNLVAGYESDGKVENRIRLLADLLCSEKPESFRALSCLGYVKHLEEHSDSPHYGIVFQMPSSFASTQLVTLRQLIREQPKPSLSTRLALSAALADCVHTFHTVDWLHKGIRSDNVLFNHIQSGNVDLSAPYMVGFQLSRPNQLKELSKKPNLGNPLEDIYRHPLAQSIQRDGTYHMSYDLYSLAIVLIEIASWQCIEDFLEIPNLTVLRPTELLYIKSDLLNKREYLERISSTSGNAYKDIINRCLLADRSDILRDKETRGLEHDITMTLKEMTKVMSGDS